MDVDLVRRAQRGDRVAFASLVDQVADRLYAAGARILRDADLAEDALQGALITAWRKLPTLREPERFEAWVRRLYVHACYEESRRRTRWSSNIRALPIEGPAGPDDVLSVDDRDQLEHAFARLSIEHRAVFVLHHHQGLSLVEVAGVLGIPAGTARSRLHYATRVLRASIDEDLAPAIPEGRLA